ncbi:MAG: GGDEF domain-containing protein [Pseudomonadota bacterium]
MKYLCSFSASAYPIKTLQLFSDVDDRRLADLLADCPVIRVTSGQSVLNTHDKSPRLYIVLRGGLGVVSDEPSGNGEHTMTTVLPGECVGELSVLDEESNPAVINALEESDLLVIDADKLWQLIDESNGVARNLLRLLSFRIRAANAQLRRRQKVGEFYRQLSMVDGLTNLQNRSWLNDHLPTLIEQAHAADNPLSLIMIDLDHFKKFNDLHGHLAGDDALRVAAMVLSDTLRPRDFAVRYGGEEFMVILPNTHKKAGLIVAQRLCERMQQARVFHDPKHKFPHITASLGLAVLVPDQDAHGLIAMADAALYRAKGSGRNQVAV